MKPMFKRWSLWLLIVGTMIVGAATGCDCNPKQLPPPPPAEISVSPKNWVINKQDLVIIPGVDFRVYGKFSIRNSAQNDKAEALQVKEITIKKKSSGKAEFKLITQKCPDQFTAATDEEKEKNGCKPTDCMIISNKNVYCTALPLSLPQELKVGDKPLEFVVEFKPSDDGVVPIADIEVVSNAPDPATPEKTETTTRIRVSAQAGEPEIVVSIGGGKLKDEKTRTRWGYSFPATKEGETARQPFSVSNNGDGTLTYSFNWDAGAEDPAKSFDVLDENGESVLGKSLTLAPKQLANFTMTFKPGDCENHTTSLRIDSNGIPKNYGEGVLSSGRILYVDLRGSSPASGSVDPNALVFDNVKPNTEAKKTFKISVGPQSLCSLKIYSLNFGAADPNDPKPKDYRFGDLAKGGATVPAPSAASPITLAKGDELIVEVIYAPKATGSESAVVLMDSNDQSLGERIVTITGATSSQIPPQAVIRFHCGEDDIKTGNDRCKTGDELRVNEVDLEGKKSVAIQVDGSQSFTIPKGSKKIVKYTWELADKPRGSKASIQADSGDPSKATFQVDVGDSTGRAIYKVKLTVEDEDGLKGSKTEELKAFGL